MSPLFVDAQDTALAKKYEQKVVYLYGSNYLLDGQKLPKSGLSVLLRKYHDSKSELVASKKWGTIGTAISLVSIALPFYGLQQYRTRNKDIRPYFFASIAINYISTPFLRKSRRHLHKSIWLYNKNALIN
jgi:hypothetical protein